MREEDIRKIAVRTGRYWSGWFSIWELVIKEKNTREKRTFNNEDRDN